MATRALPGGRAAVRAVRAAPRVPSARLLHASGAAANTPRSPFQVFVETLKEELTKSREFQDNLKQLQGESGKFQDTETMRRAREAYERARIVTSIKHNPRLQRAAEQLRKSGGQVGGAVSAALRQMEDSELMRSLSAMSDRLRRQIEESTAPMRNKEVYKAFAETLTEAFDDGGSALRHYFDERVDDRTARRLRREARLRKIGREPPTEDVEAVPTPEDPVVAAAAAAGEAAGRESAAEEGAEVPKDEAAEPPKDAAAPPPRRAGFAVRKPPVREDPNAGGQLVVAPESKSKRAWQDFKENNSFMRRLGEWNMAYQESEHPFIERLRGVTSTVSSWFEENETAQVVRSFKSLDPSFTLANFTVELREYVLPELLDAYHAGQGGLLRQWCGEATYNVLMATIDPYMQRGLIPEGRILDLSNIEILQGKMLETGPTPVLVISFSTQELMYFKDPRSGEVKAGNVDQANLCRYAVVMTRVPSELDNELTGGWKVLELARRGQAAFM